MIARTKGLIKLVTLYWGMVVVGMLLYLAVDPDAFRDSLPITVGTVAGATIGQALAVARIRGWIAAMIVLGIAVLFVPTQEALWLAYLAAALSGYWSLGDRTTLAAFWYPAVLWMLPILDGVGANTMPDRNGQLLLAALALVFVMFLRVRERRRTDLWRSVATVPLATPRPRIILRDGPRREVTRAAWVMMIATLLGVIGYWAPQLWQWQVSPAGHAPVATGIGMPCCPTDNVEIKHAHAKEYFEVRGVAHSDPPVPGLSCRVCAEPGYGVSVVSAGSSMSIAPMAHDLEVDVGPDLSPAIAGDFSGPQAAPPAVPVPTPTSAPTPMASTTAGHDPVEVAPPSPPVLEVAATPVGTPAPPAPSVPPPPAPAVSASSPATPIPAHDSATSDHTIQGPPGINLVALVIALVGGLAAVCILALLVRPVRRVFALRHLRRPLWPETVDQRVSNSWQLALVGLRDAGWRASPDEGPREFARRVGIDAVDNCATVLERARHGIAIDHDDLATMQVEADVVYRTARTRIGPLARVATWLRWPLVD